MTEHINTDSDDLNRFDRLMESRVEIAEFVNSFTSERVQRKAFEAVVCSLGLTEMVTSSAGSTVERLHIVQQQPEVEPEAADDGSTSADSSGTPRRRRSRSGAKKTFTVPRGLNFAPDGHATFEAFIAEKSPRNNDEKLLVACHYLSEMMGVAEVGIGHVLAAFQAAEWSAPAHPDTALRACASRTGWLDTGDTKAITVVWKGQNHITTKMPAAPKAS